MDRALARRSWQAGVLVLMDLDDGSVTGPGGLAERLAVLPDPGRATACGIHWQGC